MSAPCSSTEFTTSTSPIYEALSSEAFALFMSALSSAVSNVVERKICLRRCGTVYVIKPQLQYPIPVGHAQKCFFFPKLAPNKMF